jgi:Ca-activated chloride channel family protein
VKAFTEIAGNSEKGEFKANAYYNKGAVLSRQKKLEESIEAYKNTLRLNPNDKKQGRIFKKLCWN